MPEEHYREDIIPYEWRTTSDHPCEICQGYANCFYAEVPTRPHATCECEFILYSKWCERELDFDIQYQGSERRHDDEDDEVEEEEEDGMLVRLDRRTLEPGGVGGHGIVIVHYFIITVICCSGKKLVRPVTLREIEMGDEGRHDRYARTWAENFEDILMGMFQICDNESFANREMPA